MGPGEEREQRLHDLRMEREEKERAELVELREKARLLDSMKGSLEDARYQRDKAEAEVERLIGVNKAQGERHAKRCEEWAKTADQEREAKESAILQVEDLLLGFGIIARMQTVNHSLGDAQKIAAMALKNKSENRKSEAGCSTHKGDPHPLCEPCDEAEDTKKRCCACDPKKSSPECSCTCHD